VHFGKCPVPEAKLLEGAKQRYREFLGKCLPYAQNRGMTLAIENAGRILHSYPPTIRELKQLVQELEGAKVTFDIGHAHLTERRAGKRTEVTIAEHIRNMRKQIVHLHIHDNHGRMDDHLPPGDGNINFKPIVDAIREIKYDGFIIAEFWDPQRPLKTAQNGMERLKKLFETS